MKLGESEDAPQVDLRKIQIRALEAAVQLLLSARTDRVQHMRASVALAILKGDLNLGEIASHYRVTGERVRQIVKEVEAFEALPHP